MAGVGNLATSDPRASVIAYLTERFEPLPAHRRGCRAVFLYADRSDSPRRRLANIGGWSCLRCAMETTAKIVANLAAVLETRLLWYGTVTHNERRAAVRWAQRQPHDIGFFAATREGAPILLVAEARLTRRSPSRLRPRQPLAAITELVDEMLAPAETVDELLAAGREVKFRTVADRVTYTAWSDKWRPGADKRVPAGGVGAGFVAPERADEVLRRAQLEPDVPAGLGPANTAARIQEAIEGLNDKGPGRDAWGRTIDPPATKES